MKQIDTVFFDLGFTLQYPPSGDYMLTECFRSFVPEKVQMRISKEDWKKAYDDGYQYLLKNQKMDTEQEEEERMTEYYLLLTESFPEIRLSREDAKIIAHDRTYNYANYVSYPDTIETLKELKKEGYRLGIISDTYPSVVPQLKVLKVDDYFDFTTYSFAVGTCKPDPRMFTDALSKADIEGDRTVFVDDNIHNLEAADKFHIHPVLSLGNSSAKIDPRYPYINKPSDILELLKEYEH